MDQQSFLPAINMMKMNKSSLKQIFSHSTFLTSADINQSITQLTTQTPAPTSTRNQINFPQVSSTFKGRNISIASIQTAQPQQSNKYYTQTPIKITSPHPPANFISRQHRNSIQQPTSSTTTTKQQQQPTKFQQFRLMHARRFSQTGSSNMRVNIRNQILRKWQQQKIAAQFRAKNLAFKLSRRIVQKQEQSYDKQAQRFRDSSYNHSFLKDLYAVGGTTDQKSQLISYIPYHPTTSVASKPFNINNTSNNNDNNNNNSINTKRTATPLMKRVINLTKNFQDQDSFNQSDQDQYQTEFKKHTFTKPSTGQVSPISYAYGKKQLNSYLLQFKDFQRIKKNNITDNKFTAYLTECQKLRVAPRMHGIVNRKGKRSSINADNKFLGDKYAVALSQGIKKSKHINKILLSRNALTDKGLTPILVALPPQLVELDLSHNPSISKSSYDTISSFLKKPNSQLRVLKLQGNMAGDKLPDMLNQSLAGNITLRHLNISRNKITDVGGCMVADLILYNEGINVFQVHWNKIRGKGAHAIGKAFKYNKSIQIFDASFNSFGSIGAGITEESVAKAISEMFEDNQCLLHVDISHNGFSLKACEIIGNGLNLNQNVLGVHMLGNQANADANGFLRQDINPTESNALAHLFTRISPQLQTGKIKNKFKLQLKASSNCWICQGWSQVTFTYKSKELLDQTMPVFLNLECDGYQGDLMLKKNKEDPYEYKVTRMLPPGPQKYYYTVDQNPVIDQTKPTIENTQNIINLEQQLEPQTLDEEITEKMKQVEPILGDRKKDKPPRQTKRAMVAEPPSMIKKILIPSTNYIENIVQKQKLVTHTFQEEIGCVPRPLAKMIIKKKRVRTPWDFGKSVFKDYKPDNPKLLEQCFEFDWSQSKLDRILKDEEQIEFIKEYMRSNFRYLRDTYKYFSAVQPSNGVFSIGTNVFNEIVSTCAIVDKTTLKISDVDLDFVATNAGGGKKTGKMNPERQLVRYQFMEIWIRMALTKYYKTKLMKDQYQAVHMMFESHALVFMKNYDSHKFRSEKLWCEDCDRIYKIYMPVMKGLYEKYSGKFSMPGQPKFSSLDQFTQLVTDAGVIDQNFGAREIGMLFNMSMMTQVNELESERHTRMQFAEFIQAVGRVANKLEIRSGGNIQFEYSQDSDAEDIEEVKNDKPLYQKLEDFLKIMAVNCLGEEFYEQFQKNFTTLGYKCNMIEA